MDPRRAPDHDLELGDGRAHTARHARHELDRDRVDRVHLPARRSGRGAVLREEVGRARAQEAADGDAPPVPVRHRARCVHGERRRLVLARLVLRDAVHRGDGNRRPVRGDQLRDRRDDACEVPRERRHPDQRLVLGGRNPRIVCVPHLPQRIRAQRRLAAGVPSWSRARARRHRRRPHSAGEPPLAHDPRPDGRGRAGDGEDRGGGAKVRPGDRARRRLTGARARSRKAVRLRHVPAARLP